MSETPTRTRAEIQAEIEKLEEEIHEAWPKEGERVYLGCTFRKPCDIPGHCFVTIDPKDFPSCGEIVPYTSLIPAADLIPRAEHERLLAEAKGKPTNLDANTALGYLVKEYDLDTGHMDSARPRTYPYDHNGHVYEVVVRRKLTPMPMGIAPANRTACVEHLVGEFVSEGGVGKRTITHSVDGLECELSINVKGRGDTPAVAPQGVVEKLRQSIKYLRSATVGSDGCENVCDKANAALDGIVPLPPPSEFARKIVRDILGYPASMKREVAAALIEATQSAEGSEP